jgi:hypothetical protein
MNADGDTVFDLLDGALKLPQADREGWIASSPAPDDRKREAIRLLSMISTEPFAEPVTGSVPTLAAKQLGDFRVIRPIGAGASGVVYEAEQRMPCRRVALKVLRSTGDPAAIRVASEAQALAMLSHPGIATVFAAGIASDDAGQGAAWIAMELIEDAIDVRDRCGTLAGDGPSVMRLMHEFAAALAHAHAGGVVHHDIKPANFLVDRAGRAKIVDFGISCTRGSPSAPAGTPRWMAPECAAGRTGDPRSDVWSFGMVLRDCCDAADLGRNHVLRRVADMACEPDPRRRYPDASGLAADIDAAENGRRMSCRAVGPIRRAVTVARRYPRIAAGIAASIALSAVLAVIAANQRAWAEQALLLEALRGISMHGEMTEVTDGISPEERESAARKALRRGIEAVEGNSIDPHVALVSVATLLRLDHLDDACAVARNAVAKLGRPEDRGDRTKWLSVFDACCEAVSSDSQQRGFDRLHREIVAIARTSMADDVALACYVSATAFQSRNERIGHAAAELAEVVRGDLGGTATGTMLELTRLAAVDGAVTPAGHLDPLLVSIDRWCAPPMGEYLAPLFLELAIAGIDRARLNADEASFLDARDIARRAAAGAGRLDLVVWAELTIGCHEWAYGHPTEAARVFDAIAELPGLSSREELTLTYWLPQRVALALRAGDRESQLHRILESVRRVPVLGSGDVLLLECLEAWDSGDRGRCQSLLATWRERQQKRPHGDVRSMRIELGDRLADLVDRMPG